MSPTKDGALFERLFQPPKGFDIEHIQSFKAENENTRQDLGWSENDDELNKIGNLAMFESNLNRSVKNKQLNKQSAYAQSSYVCIRKIKDRVSNWSKKDAKQRRIDISKALESFLFSLDGDC